MTILRQAPSSTISTPTITRGVCHDDAHRISHEVLGLLCGTSLPRGLAMRYWDDTIWPETMAQQPARATLVLARPNALRLMLLPPTERSLGEAYIQGVFDIEGDIEAAFQLKEHFLSLSHTPARLLQVTRLLRRLPGDEPRPLGEESLAARLRGPRHSRQRDRHAIQYHYDLSNDFYALWLDRRMVYSCAYFETGTEDIDTAQEAKLDLICRKLRLQPGERLLDVGCGWGGLIAFAAERYGVDAVGVTLSARQAALARERIAAADLAGRVKVLLGDYRDLPRSQPFDKIASVGMFEHVGRDHLPEYFHLLNDLLKPAGLFLNHGISTRRNSASVRRRLRERLFADRASFMRQYVFPDGETVPLSEALGAAERAGWEVRDVESLREHYARTLRLWRQRLEGCQDKATRMVGGQTYRVWRLYLAGCAYNFTHEYTGVYQTLLAKPDASGNARLPLTRADIYRRDHAGTSTTP